MTEQEAIERVKDIKSFYGHFLSYLLVNAGLLTTFFLAGGAEAVVGPLIVLFAWGAGLSVHAMRVFGFFGLGSAAWEEQKVRELLFTSRGTLSGGELAHLLSRAISEASEGPESTQNERILRRLENLETIVTSHDWDALPRLEQTDGPGAGARPDEPSRAEESAEARSSRLADRIR